MSNHATIRDIESRKKVVELENCNRALTEIMKVNSFSSALMLASSVKINNIRSEEVRRMKTVKLKYVKYAKRFRESRRAIGFYPTSQIFFEKIANIIQGQQEQQNNEPYGKEVIWKYDALPEGRRIDLGQTFTNQRNRVINDIIPSIMENINNNIFPISNEILYDIIHSLHRHRREEHLKKNRSSSRKKLQEKRKHSNSRRHDVSK
ncbi:hypothetical protein GLOIN_2v1470219 [Rhizophagus irregularis DAOM 181602=DAOM 197198]|nr:hypothetical protein GLOIN_2v1470219 [Rhizophagus irregularis DAOM 181602=DAOM 197198]